MCMEENLQLFTIIYWSSSSSMVTMTSVWGLMIMVALMRNLSAFITRGSVLNMKFFFLNQGCLSKYIVLNSDNVRMHQRRHFPPTWIYLCSGWARPRPPQHWRSGHSSCHWSTARSAPAGRCPARRRGSRGCQSGSAPPGMPPGLLSNVILLQHE